MEYHREPPKDWDRTKFESKTLFGMYEDIVERWRTNQWSSYTAKELSEQFAYIYGRRHFDDKAPSVHLEYLSEFGAARVNIWSVNRSKKSIVVSTDIYAQGPDKKVRGKGRQAFDFFDAYYQSLADQTGYAIYRLDTPNAASERYMSADEGFHDVSDDEFNLILMQADQYTILKVFELICGSHENTKYKKYRPAKDKPSELIPGNILEHIENLAFID